MSSSGSCASQSWVSCGVNWKYQTISPLRGRSATTEFVYRLSPGRRSPFLSGHGLPVAQ